MLLVAVLVENIGVDINSNVLDQLLQFIKLNIKRKQLFLQILLLYLHAFLSIPFRRQPILTIF
jgi:hypothetical protein